LPPTLVRSLESRPIEEVLFLRDELANMSWGIEHVIESASEQQLNRFEQQRNEAAVSSGQVGRQFQRGVDGVILRESRLHLEVRPARKWWATASPPSSRAAMRWLQFSSSCFP